MYSKAGIKAVVNYIFWLCGLQSKRISAKDALAHPYLDEGRLRYHTCMCKCCYTTSSGRVYTSDFEPVTNPKFDDGFEKNLSAVRQVKGECIWGVVGTDIGFGFAIDEGIKKQQLSVLLKVMIVSVITGLVGIVVIGSLITCRFTLCVSG